MRDYSDVRIMVIEDNDEDYVATQRAFTKVGALVDIKHLESANLAISYLGIDSGESLPHSQRPHLIILDLNLPGLDGREFLQILKTHAEYGSIPVIILTTSSNKVDVNECYLKGANSYMLKPVDFGKYLEGIRHLKEYWLDTALIPG
ncbi:MAG: response regulator [Planctomycetales bacterium]|nr:response regulator [bacterium]UNM08020.1 MAG: response regulator [Planctomycetales bacterium]